MSFNPGDEIKAQWDWLFSTLQTATQSGGALHGIQDVRRGLMLWTGVTPAIGVQFMGAKFKDYTQRARMMTAEFMFVVAAQSTPATAAVNTGTNAPPNVDDANQLLQPFISDGNGNGLLSLLLNPTYRLLSGLVMRSYFGSIDYQPDIRPAGAPDQGQIWMYAFVSFFTEQEVSIV